ncbi:Methyl-CpG-binding domain protein 5 [Asimina triloba]
MRGEAAAAAAGEENLVSEDSQAQFASCADRCSSLQQQEDSLSDSEGRIEAGLEMGTSAEGGFRTLPMEQGAAEEPRTSLDLVVVPTSEFTPDWLPAGWTMEVRVRNSGISAGTKDKLPLNWSDHEPDA